MRSRFVQSHDRDDVPELPPGAAVCDILESIRDEVMDETGCTEEQAEELIDHVIAELVEEGEIDPLPDTDDPNDPRIGQFLITAEKIDLRQHVLDSIEEDD